MRKLEKILLVEDEEDIQTIASMALNEIGGYNVSVCSRGAEALETVKEFKPDLILLDVMMPEMDGPTTLKHLKENLETASIPVIFLTAKAQNSERERFKSLGAIEVIPKPFDPVKISEIVNEIWEKFA